VPRSRLSVVVIGHESADLLPACLESVRWADEIVYVDGGSRDDSIAVARRFGAKIIESPSRLGLNHNKEVGRRAATGAWILSLDTDERVEGDLRAEIESLLARGDGVAENGFRVPSRIVFMGRWIRSCGWYPRYQVKLFRQTKGGWPTNRVHEPARADEPIGTLRGHIVHENYRDLDEYWRKFRFYVRTVAAERLEDGWRPTAWTVVRDLGLKPPVVFARKYLGQGGWREGVPGLFVAASAAISLFASYAAAWEASVRGRALDRPAGPGRE
jgi:(heptosyl)LPS beta-1,4-glucosyltransferase